MDNDKDFCNSVSSIQQYPFARFAHSGGQVEMIISDQYMTKPVDILKFLSWLKN